MSLISNNQQKCAMALNSLVNVYDPEIGLSVVDLGLIYQLDFDDEAKEIYCTMTLTTRFCPMGESITDGVKQALEESFPDRKIQMHVTFNPPWNYEMISESGKKTLNK